MKLLSWNIQHGGGSRIDRIADAIITQPDVIALSEFRTRPGAVLCAKLTAAGWPTVESTIPAGNDNGLCVLSRTPMQRTRPCPAPPENLARWLDIDLPEYGFGFGLLHILCSVPKLRDGCPVKQRRASGMPCSGPPKPGSMSPSSSSVTSIPARTGETRPADVRLCRSHREAVRVGLRRSVAAPQPRSHRVDVVLDAEGRRAGERLPAGSCLRDAGGDGAREGVPVFPWGAGGGNLGSLDDDCRGKVDLFF
jgi:hypothetical protein